MKPYTAKNRIVSKAYETIHENEQLVFSDEEWDAVSYAIYHAVDLAFDAGMREQRKKQAVHKKMYEVLNT